jgi:uncharacterized protein
VHKIGAPEPVAARVGVADRFWLRARGLLGRLPLEGGEGLLIRPCRAVHTIGLRYPIDVAFLDEGGTVVATYPALQPNRRTRWHGNAASALELPAGTLEETATSTGQRLRWEA